MKDWLPRLVARVPATVHTKLLVAFLMIVVLLITFGLVGLQVLSGVNRRAEETAQLQRKIAAYRQLKQGTTAQLYSVASALLVPDEQTLDATLRQLDQFGYDYDRLQFVAKDEAELLDEVRKDYDQFIHIVTRVVELLRAGKAHEGRELQLAQVSPLADRLERLTNQLVNRAAADMVASIETSQGAYLTSRWVVIGSAVGSIGLALILGYAFSWSLIGPVKEMDARLKQIASGDFSQHVEVLNRDELGTLAANLNRMNDELGQLYQQLETANRHKSDFLASMSHEFRTPLNAIIGYGRLVRRATEGQISPLQRENLQDLLNNAERLLNLIDSLLDFAKIEAGKMAVRVEPVRVSEIIHGAASTIESILNSASVRLVREIAPDIPPLNTDREKLRQIILNLLGNAVKFTERGEIRIAACQQNGSLKLVVSDTGIGIEKKDLDQIFEKFHQGDLSSSKKYRGTGLGLAIVKQFVNLLGGEITVESEVGKGSVFTVTLPLDYGESVSLG
ncbi:MAG TPA: ATP-binding protein [Blastocatellia bacterium]|jgi:signal transduction histidine kinase|nr:ATP-binding protein [Blastocatellia bacterium]